MNPIKKLPHYKHIRRLGLFERQALSAYRTAVNGAIKEIRRLMRSEKLAKSKGKGWTGDIPRIEIDVTAALGPILDRYVLGLQWLMLGVGAGKEATEAAKALKWSKLFTPGIMPALYMDSLDTQSEWFKQLTGAAAPKMPSDFVATSVDEMVKRTRVFLDQATAQFRAVMLGAAQNAVDQQDVINLNAAQQARQTAGDDEEIDLSDATEMMRLSMIEAELRSAANRFENNWDVAVKANLAKASGVGAHQAMVELFGSDDPDMKVAIIEMEDERVCDFCKRVSKHPDGSFKLYRLNELKPTGYNMGRKKADWAPVIPPSHPRCRCQAVHVPGGFEILSNGTVRKKS